MFTLTIKDTVVGAHWNAFQHISRHVFGLQSGTALPLIGREKSACLSKFHAVEICVCVGLKNSKESYKIFSLD